MNKKTILGIILAVLVVIFIGLAMYRAHTAKVEEDASMTGSIELPDTAKTGAKAGTKASPTVRLGAGPHASTTSLVVGQKVVVTVPTTGHVIDPVQYDSAILSLAHTGDTWEFTAIKAGTTGITITANQGTPNSTSTLFSAVVSVK